MPRARTFRMRLIVGDWSQDGHNMTESFTVEANHGAAAVKSAYKKGSKIVGVDLTKNVCRNYEDSTLQDKDLRKLIKAGWVIPGTGTEDDPICDDTEGLSRSEFVELWLFIVRKGNADLEIEVVEDEETINIGGYGLFYP